MPIVNMEQTVGKKLRSKSGFTFAELLVAITIVSLLGVAVATGLSAAAKAKADITRISAASILSGTIAVELADELRFAQNITVVNSSSPQFDSRRFGPGAVIESSADGHITVGGREILPQSIYEGLMANVNVQYISDRFQLEIVIANSAGDELDYLSLDISPLTY